MLDEHHRVVVADGGDQHALRVARRRRHDHLQPGHVREPGVQRLAVLVGLAPAAADDGADHHRHFHRAAGAVGMRGDHVDELVHAEQQEVHAHVHVDRPHAVDRRAQAEPGHGVLGELRAEAAGRAELLHQALGAVEDALVVADVDAVGEHGAVAPHLFLHRLVQGVAIRDAAAHASTSS